ncbi:MAG: hypothetical protein CL916_14535 [Deltaproteobacteria bacterium]|nr:hypothetical protein [Deltaproteobacteria bacterium]
MNIRGKAWCPKCEQNQPAVLVGLSVNGLEKTVTGFCSICEHPVHRRLTSKPKTTIHREHIQKDNCVPLHSKSDPQNEPSEKNIKQVPEIEKPSLLALLAIFSGCLVITYLL